MPGLNELDQIDYGMQYSRGEPSITQQSGLAGLTTPAISNIARANQDALDSLRSLGTMEVGSPQGAPPAPRGPVLAISRSTGQIWANGKLFTLDDAQGALDSQQFVNGAPVPAPAAAAGDWEPLDIDAYSQHIEKIKNPGMGTLAAKNFGIGVDNMQMLGGYGLQFLGAEETGKAIVQSQLADITKNAPYQRNFDEIGSDPNRGVMDWFIANLAQQGPNLVESAVTAAIGAAAGGAAGGGANPVTAVGGALTAMVGKQAFKQSLLAAAKKYMAGEALDIAEQKLLREAAGITAAAVKAQGERIGKDIVVDSAGNAARYTADDAVKALLRPGAEAAAAGGLAQARAGGAAIATGLQNYGTGVADMYGETVEGGDPSRGYAALAGVPYAALETLPEFFAAARIFKGVGASTKSLAGLSTAGKAGELGLRAAKGAGAGAALEGTTELGQEALGIAGNAAIDLDSPEGVSRMLNAFAAGAAIGGFIGAGSNMNTGKPHDLLSAGTKPADQGGSTILSGEVIPPTPPNGMKVPDGSVPLLGGPGAAAPALGGPAPVAPEAPVTGVQFAQPQLDIGPAPGVSPETVLSPLPGQAPVNMLPGASTIYQGQDPSVQPPLQITGSTAPAPVAPQLPPVINAPGPEQYGSALSQVAAGDLPGAVPPPSPALNRLQQLQQQARTQTTEANSQSALAQTARATSEGSPTLAQLLQQKGTAGQSAPASTGKSKLAKGKAKPKSLKKVDVVDAAAATAKPGGALEKLINNGIVTAPVELKKGKAVQKVAEETSTHPVHDKFIAELDDARLNLATKKELRSLVTRALKAGVLSKEDAASVEYMFKDRDMSADDIAPELSGMIEQNKAEAPAPAEAAPVEKPEPKPRPIKPEKKFSFGENKTVSEAPSPKAEGAAAAPSQKAEKETSQPGTALALVDNKKTTFVDPVVEATLAKQAREAQDFANSLAADDPKVALDNLIIAVNTADLGSNEYNDYVAQIIETAQDKKLDADIRKKASDYIENEVDPELLKVMERGTNDAVTQAELDRSTIVIAMEQINNGELTLTQSLIGALTAAWKRIKSLNIRYGDAMLADYIKGGPTFFNMKDGKVVPKAGRFSTMAWNDPDTSLDVGKVKLTIGKFISKFASKPTVHVYKSQADLKAQNPTLHARMAAGRPGDFDTVKAAGYSLYDEIVIFTDRIGSEDHLSFVLAHEILGHYGMRGLMGNAEFNKVMESLYDTDRRLKAGVDAAMAARGLKKAEAVEEYLADYAAQLHTSLVKRVWNGVKNVLNHVGIKFGDEALRYILSQSKRYVRTGEKAGVFNTSSVLHRIWGVETAQVGRFSVVDTANEQEALADHIRWSNAIPMSLKDAAKHLKDTGMSWDKIKETFFSLSNYQALRNPGLYAFDKLLDETRQYEQYIYNQYNEKLEKLLYKNEKHKGKVSRMLLDGRAVAVYKLLNDPFTVEDMKEKLFTVNDQGELELDNGAMDKYIQRGLLSFEEMRDGVTVKRDIKNEDGTVTKEDHVFKGFSDLTQDEYNDYVLARQTMASVEIDLLRAKYANALRSQGVSAKAVKRMLKKGGLKDAERMVKRTLNKYREIYVAGYTVDERGNLTPGTKEIEDADKFLEAVNRAILSADSKNDQAVRDFFTNQKEADDYLAGVAEFRANKKIPDGDLTFLFQNELKRAVLDDVNLTVEEERAKRTMAGGYVPIIRDKAYQMRVQAVNSKGDPVVLHEDHKKLLVYSQFDNLNQAQTAAEMIGEAMKGKTVEMWVQQPDGSFDTEKVSFKVEYGEARAQVSADPSLNLDEFMHGLRLFKINLSPDKMTKVIQTLTEAGDQLRKRLANSNTPGYDKNSGVFAMTRHIHIRAATIAKTITRPQMRELMDMNTEESRDLWYGNKSAVFSLHTRWKDATDPAAKAHYRHQLDHALNMFVETYPDAKGWDGSKAGYDKIKDSLKQNNAERFYNSAQRALEFLDQNQSVSESDFGSGKVASTLRAATSIFQLGGSIAQGVMNMVSPYTNWFPYMASYNQRTGFGGGFSAGHVMTAYHTAIMQVGVKGLAGGKFNTADYYDQLMRNPTALAKSGLTLEEAEFLALEIREGKLKPAQANALLGTARTGATNRYVMRGIDTFMAPFNVTEQASRRAAALAAFRLAYKRTANVKFDGDPKKNAEMRVDAARDFAIQSLDLTLGEYSVLNRPAAWRNGIQSFLYMYKVYPTTTIQLMRRLDKKGQIIMLGTLWMMAGVTGFPFAEDIEDLIDTIAQALGLQMGSVRAEFIKILDGIAPGLSPYVLKGAVNTALGIPADVASRFSMGDFIPGSGILLAGATVGQEIKEIVGPMPAMAIGMATFTRDLISFPFSEGTSLQDTLRASPITLGRMVGDTWAYASNGAVVDKRGYVVSPDMNIGIMAFRLMGFYPKGAADQYDAIRIAKRVNNYQKEVVASYRTAWVQAMMQGNRAYARQIEEAVAEWNRSAKGTQLEIANFRKNSERALKEARSSAMQRTLKATSKTGREEASRLMDAMVE